MNYAGVIIGEDLRYDNAAGAITFNRSEYHDKKGRENNPKLGIKYSDQDLLEYVRNIYTVLLTRGIFGTYIYVCNEELRGLFTSILLDNRGWQIVVGHRTLAH